MADLTREQWAAAVLNGLGYKQSPGAMQALVGWARAEGGNWNNSAKYNPLNTTQDAPGSKTFRSVGQGAADIRIYKNWDQGIDATIQTLKNGRYGGILSGLQNGDPNAVAKAIDASPWGTHGSSLYGAIQGAPSVSGVAVPGSGSSSGGSTSSVQALTSAPSDPGQGADVSALLSQLSQSGFQKPTASAASLPAPAATAGPALPAGYKALTTSGGPAPKQDISSLLSMVSTPGQAAANALTSQSSLVADASTPTSGSSGGTSGASAGTGGAQAALGWAESKVGFKETGENSGGLASYLNQRFGFSNAPWCAMFTSAAVTKGGAPLSARTASVAEVRRQAVNGGGGYQKGFIDPGSAKAGDLILFGDDHVAMVQRVKNGKVFYVGGNQSDGVTESSVAAGSGDIVRPKYGARHH